MGGPFVIDVRKPRLRTVALYFPNETKEETLRSILWGAGAIAAFALAAPSIALATSVGKQLDLMEIADEADAIVAGTVVGSEARRVDGSMYTFVSISVDETLKGSTGGTVTVAVPGGPFTSGRFKLAEVVAGAPLLAVDTEQLLFLDDNAAMGAYSVVGFSQGAFALSGSGEEKSFTAPGGKKTSLKEARKLVKKDGQ
jgi:hypothetical protein